MLLQKFQASLSQQTSVFPCIQREKLPLLFQGLLIKNYSFVEVCQNMTNIGIERQKTKTRIAHYVNNTFYDCLEPGLLAKVMTISSSQILTQKSSRLGLQF